MLILLLLPLVFSQFPLVNWLKIGPGRAGKKKSFQNNEKTFHQGASNISFTGLEISRSAKMNLNSVAT